MNIEFLDSSIVRRESHEVETPTELQRLGIQTLHIHANIDEEKICIILMVQQKSASSMIAWLKQLCTKIAWTSQERAITTKVVKKDV